MSKHLEVLKTNKSFWHNPFIVVFATIIVFFTSQLIAGFLVAPLALTTQNKNLEMALYVVGGGVSLFALLSLAMQVIGFNWQSLGYRKSKQKYVLVVPLAFVGYLAVSASLTLLAQRLIPGFDVEQVQDIGFSDTRTTIELITAFVGLVVVTPVFEETIFRGMLFKGLRKQTPFWLSAGITSVLFAVAHGQLNVAVDTFALSLLLCFLVEKSGSIWPAILLHALKNGLAFMLLFIVGR